jgi:hypothetical protein
MNKRFLIRGVLALSAALFFRCALTPFASGGGTDFPNTRTVVGILVSPDGKPSHGSKVMLVSKKFNVVADGSSSPVLEDTTDSDGIYRFSPADTGDYTITAVQPDERTRAIISDVHVQGDTLRVDPAVMRAPGAIKITLPEGVSANIGYVYIPGTTVSVMLNGNGSSATLDSVPAGIIPSVNYGEVEHPEVNVIRYNIEVSPKKTTTVLYPFWSYAKKIFLNTTADGAAVSGNVVGFPVLIRLSSKNFAFAQTQAGGDDIRFSKTDGTSLFYEIEKWDAAGADAAIWVRVDTIFGNNDSQCVTMYWGASPALTGPGTATAPESNGMKVFDTANGFQGVWHFSGLAGAGVDDATANGYYGTPRGNTLPGSVRGIIGNANVFNGKNFIEMQGTAGSTLNFPEHGTYSVSAWVNIDSLSGEYQMIASKGDKQYNLQFKGATKNWQFTEYQDTTGWDETVSGAAARVWAYLVGVRSNQKQYLYVNGACADSGIYNLPFSPSDTTYAERHGLRNTACNFMIGKKVDYADWFFKGVIDEVRVSSRAQSPDWIKLCYMNQKSSDMLVVFQK